jgi:hypothetical protein
MNNFTEQRIPADFGANLNIRLNSPKTAGIPTLAVMARKPDSKQLTVQKELYLVVRKLVC